MNAKDLLDSQFLEMRWRCLSLAADLDRVQRSGGGAELLQSDPRLTTLLRALSVLQSNEPNRAERVQDLFSDHSAPPIANRVRRAGPPPS
jgi:hypothetical protein